MFRPNAFPLSVFAGLLWLMAALPLHAAGLALQAQPVLGPVDAARGGYIEVGVEHHVLSDDLGNWQGGYLRGVWQPDTDDVVNFEVVDTRRFGQSGRYAALGLTRNINDRWFASATVGAGDGAFFWPRWRADLAVSRKWLADRSLVTTVGYTHYQAPDGHVDRTGLLAVAWYAPRHFVLEAGLRPNRSSPGGIRSDSGFAALTWGEDGKQYLSLRHDRGSEAYQTIGSDTQLVDFPSHVTTLGWRRWVTRRCGFNLRLEYYANPNYERHGGDAGIFCGF